MKLIYTCISWWLILWIIAEPTHSFHYGHQDFSWGGLNNDFYWLSDIWFLRNCFLYYYLLYLCVHSWVKKQIWIPISLILSQGGSPFYFYLYPCFLIGWLIKGNDELYTTLNRCNPVLLILFCIMLPFWDLDAWQKSHGLPSNIFESGIMTILETESFRFLRLFIGINGSLSVISIFQHLLKSKSQRISSFCSIWGAYTLETYIFQSIIIERILHRYINISNSICCPSIVLPLISFVILSLCVSLTILLQRSKVLAQLQWG